MKYPKFLRLWHWLNVLVIIGSLLTVLLNSTLLDVRDNTAYVQQELQDAGVSVTNEQARGVAHGLEDKVWGIHIYFGYALAGLFFIRILMGFFQPKNDQFFSKLKLAWSNYRSRSRVVESALHDFIVKGLYLAFYVLFTLMALTGLSLSFEDELGLSRSFAHTIKEVHGFIMYPILAFIVIHIVGVILAERSLNKGIISDMINGGEDTQQMR